MRSVIVVGSGIAGLSAALRLSSTHDVTLITKSELEDSNTRRAQGGIAAVLAGGPTADSAQAHVLDTLRAGAGLADYAAAEALCTDAATVVAELIGHGVAFDRVASPASQQGADGLARGLEAAHSHPRVLHAGGDATGAACVDALACAVRKSDASIIEHAFLTDLIVDDGTVVGVRFRRHGADSAHPTGAAGVETLCADAVIIATGGAGQLYRHTTNPTVATGDGVAAAWRAGARLSDLEFYQFHPTALAVPGNFLISEAVRGEGAVLLNAAGERFMRGIHPDAELAPRDVVARSIAAEMAAQGGIPVRLDATALGRAFLSERFPTITAATRRAGFDWADEPVPVTPAAHYWMGGIATDLNGRTSLPGLYAIGEAACTGVHGANRLASNSLLEALVFASRAAADIASLRRRAPAGTEPDAPTRLTRAAQPRSSASPSADAAVQRSSLQHLMWDDVGILRSADSLRHAERTLDEWAGIDDASATIEQLENTNMLQLSRLIVRAAAARDESRGAHRRDDFPQASAEFEHHQSLSREEAFAC